MKIQMTQLSIKLEILYKYINSQFLNSQFWNGKYSYMEIFKPCFGSGRFMSLRTTGIPLVHNNSNTIPKIHK